MEWLLFITLAITSSPGGHAAIETIAFQSEQSCEKAKEMYLDANKNIKGLEVTALCVSQITMYRKAQ